MAFLKIVSISLKQFTFHNDFNFSEILMSFYKIIKSAAILETNHEEIKNCHGRVTANYTKFLSSHSIYSKM